MNSEITTDNMSNEEVIDTLKGIVFNGFDRTTSKERQALDFAIKTLEERPKGEWIDLPKAFDSNEKPCKCSACGHILSFMNYYPKSNFCPNCGAKMQNTEDS